MAFFGSGDSDQLVKQLKGQLAQKDFEIQTLVNEQAKREELFTESQRAKDDAVYKAQTEQERAHKAETALTRTTAELANANIRLANMESTLQDSSLKQKLHDKEIDRLQYELDARGNSSAAAARVQSTVNGLQEEIKSLKRQLEKVQSEKETLENEARLSSSGGIFGNGGFGGQAGSNKDRSTIMTLENEVAALRRENLKLMQQSRSDGSVSATPARLRAQNAFPESPRRSKRALSFSGGNSVSRIQALEAEVEQLRSQAMPGLDLKEIEKLRTDLAAAKRQALKMENEKMALERSIEREMEDIKSKLSDANDELDYLRSLDGQSAQKQLDDAKKAAKQERQSLEDRLGKQQDDLEQRSIVIHRLEFRLKEVEADLQDKQQSFLTLEQELAATKSGSSNGNMMNSQSQIEAVREDLIAKTQERDAAMSQVKELQKELRNMSVQTSDASIAAPATAQADKILRAIQRENAALKRDKAALEDNLAEIEDLVMTKDAEILALASRMPLPDGQEDDDSEVMATGDTSEIRIALAETIENLQTITSEKDALERKLQQLEATLSNSKRELLQHEEEIELLRTRLTEQQSHVGDRANEESELRSCLASQSEVLSAMKLDLAAKEASVGDLTLKLSAALACQSDNAVRAGEVEKVAAERDDQAKRLIESNVRAAELEQQIEELKRNLQTLTGEQTSIADELNTANGESQRAQEEILKMQKTYELLQNENQAAKLKAHAQLKEKNENIHQKDAEVQELLAQIAESDQELHDLQEKVAELETISQNLEMETQGKDLVDDLRAEITSQALSLQELTEQHRQSLADYEKSQLELDRHKLKKESELTALRESLEESQRLLEFADVEHNILDKALVDNKTAATIAEAAVERVRRELAEVETLLQEERDRNVDSESQLQQKLTRTEDDFAALQLEYDDLLDTKASVEDKVKTFLQDVSKKETQIRDLQEALRIANTDSTEDKLVHLQNSARELEGKVSRRTNQIAVEQAKLQKVEMNLEMANESIAEYEETIVALNGTVSDKEREVDELKTDLVRYTARLEERDTTIASLQDSVNAHLQEAKKLQTQVETASQRCVVLQEQIDFANTLKENQLSELDLKHNRAETVSTEKIKQLTEEISRLKAENLDDLSQLASKHETAIIELEDKIRDLTASIEVQQEAHAEAVEKMRSETKLLEDSLDRATAELACASSNATRSQEAQEESALELSQQKDLVMELHSRLAEASEAARAESEDLQNGIRQGQLQVEELTTKLETAERNLAFETNKVTALSQDVEAKQAELASVQDELRQLVQEHSRLDSKAAEEEIALRNDLDTLRMTCEALRSDISSAQAEHLASMDKVETEKAELVANVDSMAEVLKEARQAAASQQRLVVAHECDLALTKEEIAQISHDRGQHVELAAALEAEKTGFLSRISEMEDQLGLVHHQVTALTSEVSTASLGATDLELKRDAALIEIDRLLAQIMEHDSITDELNATKAAMERELSDALQASTKWQAEYNKLSKQLEEHIIEVKETRNAASAADAAREQLEIDFAKRDKEIDGLRQQLAAELTQTTKAVMESARLQALLVQTTSDHVGIVERSRQLQTQIENLTREAALSTDDVTRLEKQLEAVQIDLEEQMAEVRNASKAKAQLQRKVDKLERKIKTLADVPAQAPAPQVLGNLGGSPAVLAGQKRSRETGTPTKKTATAPEVVIAPSPFDMNRTPLKRFEPRLGFTPTRTILTPKVLAAMRSNNVDENTKPKSLFS